MVDWKKYLDKDPSAYDWDKYWAPDNGSDAIARPHRYIYVGSCCTEVPSEVNTVLNVADECRRSNVAMEKAYYKIGLIDPGDVSGSFSKFNEAVQLLCHLVDFCRDIVFVHCASGMSRSISVAATASAILDNSTVIEKIKQIANLRSEIWPEPCYVVMGRILNKEF